MKDMAACLLTSYVFLVYIIFIQMTFLLASAKGRSSCAECLKMLQFQLEKKKKKWSFFWNSKKSRPEEKKFCSARGKKVEEKGPRKD